MPAFCSQAESAAADGICSPRMPENSRGSSSMPWNRAAFTAASRRRWISSPWHRYGGPRHSCTARHPSPGWLRIPAPGSGCPSRKFARPMSPRAVPSDLSSIFDPAGGHALQRARRRFQLRRKRASSSFESPFMRCRTDRSVLQERPNAIRKRWPGPQPCGCEPGIDMADRSGSGIAARLPNRPCARSPRRP